MLRVKPTATGDVLRPGTIYVVVPAQYLLVRPNGTLLLSDTAKMNIVRPATDKLLLSYVNSYYL